MRDCEVVRTEVGVKVGIIGKISDNHKVRQVNKELADKIACKLYDSNVVRPSMNVVPGKYGWKYEKSRCKSDIRKYEEILGFLMIMTPKHKSRR